MDKRVGKMLVGITLSFALLSSGAITLSPKSTHAASADLAVRVISSEQQFMGVPYLFVGN